MKNKLIILVTLVYCVFFYSREPMRYTSPSETKALTLSKRSPLISVHHSTADKINSEKNNSESANLFKKDYTDQKSIMGNEPAYSSKSNAVNAVSAFGMDDVICNTDTPWINSTFGNNLTVSTHNNTNWNNLGSVLDSNVTNSASTSSLISVGSTKFISVKDIVSSYTAGTYAGYRISLSGISGVTLKIITYQGGTMKEEYTVNSSSLLGTGIFNIGFTTSESFDEVKLEYTEGVGVASSINVYHAFLSKKCAGPVLMCSTLTNITRPSYPVIINENATGATGIGSVSAAQNVIDADLTNYATLAPVALSAAYLSVKNEMTVYPAETFVGFRIQNQTLLSLDLLNDTSIVTYLGGVQQQSISGNALLLNVGLLNFNAPTNIGFVTSLPFDEVQIQQSSTVNLGSTRVYNVIMKRFCEGPSLPCNVYIDYTEPDYPITINSAETKISGVLAVGSSVTTPEAIIDNNSTNFATITVVAGVGTSGTIAVKKALSNFDAGTFAGFEIENTQLLNLGLLDNIVVSTYKDGVFQESISGGGLLVGLKTDLLSTSGKQIVGLISTQEFDEVRLTINSLVAVNLGTTNVLRFVVKRFCEGAPLPCNVYVDYSEQDYPVAINSAASGISGTVAVGTVSSPGLIIDNDPNSFATITVTAGVGSSGTIAVKKALSKFEIGTFAGFEIENTQLLNLSLLDNVSISTYNDGVFQESISGSGLLVGLNTDLLGSQGKNTIGLLSTKVFNEVRLTINSLVAVNLGTTKVYKFIVFKGCAPVINCNNIYVLKNPELPIIINYNKTGVQGVACIQCKVEDAQNLIDDNDTNKAKLYTTVGALGAVDISILDPISTFPKGSFAGFTISQDVVLLNLNLLNFIQVTTYLDGVLQETNTGSSLLDLSLLYPISAGQKNIGFYTTKDFDEIQLTLIPVVSVINLVNVHKVFIDTSTAIGTGFNCITATDDNFQILAGSSSATSVLSNDVVNGAAASPSNVTISPVTSTDPGITIDTSTGIINVSSGVASGTYTFVYSICDSNNLTTCNSATVTIVVSGACYKPANNTGVGSSVSHGITSLSRAGSENGNWPMVRKGAWTVLESKSKGFIVNRIPTTAALANITHPIEGMLVYDEEAASLKIYTLKDGETILQWHTITTQTCPD